MENGVLEKDFASEFSDVAPSIDANSVGCIGSNAVVAFSIHDFIFLSFLKGETIDPDLRIKIAAVAAVNMSVRDFPDPSGVDGSTLRVLLCDD